MLLRQNEMHVMKCAQGLTSEPGNCITTPCERHTKVTPLNFSEKNRRDALIFTFTESETWGGACEPACGAPTAPVTTYSGSC